MNGIKSALTMSINVDKGSEGGDQTAIASRLGDQQFVIPDPFASALADSLGATNQKFVKAIFSMRRAQKEYFKTRSAEWLRNAKMLEKEVDEHLKNIFKE